MKHALKCIINAICGKACPSAYISPSPEYSSKPLTGFQGPPVPRGGMAPRKS